MRTGPCVPSFFICVDRRFSNRGISDKISAMSEPNRFEPIDLSKIETYELESRPSKVVAEDFARPVSESESLREFLKKFPGILASDSLRRVAERIRNAKEKGKPVIWGIGGHVIKTGLAPVMIDLMKRGHVSLLAANGSVLVHDSEMAMVGFTSEDVDASLSTGDFGAAKETGDLLNGAAKRAMNEGRGLGSVLGEDLRAKNLKFPELSLLKSAHDLGVPFTAHLTIGTDIGNFHPNADGASLGAASHTDFRIFCSAVKELDGGGVYLNIGSAVTMPEIFLKAVTVVRNLGNPLREFTTANFDFIQHYRPLTNVVRRPVANGAGQGFAITGHHEIMIPLLAAHIICGE